MFEQILAACFVIGLLFVTVWLLRKKGFASTRFSFGREARERKMQLLERLALTPQHSLHLVRIENELVVVGVSPSSCSNLKSWAAPAEQTEFRGAV